MVAASFFFLLFLFFFLSVSPLAIFCIILNRRNYTSAVTVVDSTDPPE